MRGTFEMRAAHDGAFNECVRLPPTPLLPVQLGVGQSTIWCKAEYMHPSGSTKDRIAAHILSQALRAGQLKIGGEVAEASSGSTSIAMSMMCSRLGLHFTAFMPEGVSRERSLMIRAYGGHVILTPKEQGMAGSLQACREWAKSRGAFEPRQFENMDNAQAHRLGTAVEILQQVPGGRVDAYVSGVGTGGTIVGLRLGFQDAGQHPKAIAARPIAGAGGTRCDCFAAMEQCSFSASIPGVLDDMSHLYHAEDFVEHQVVQISDEVAMQTTRELIGAGHPVGPSSGLNVAAALHIAHTLPPDAVIVTVLCDRMERYFSTELFTQWPKVNG